MNRIKNRLVEIGLAGLLTISGCSGFTIGGMEPTNRKGSSFGDVSDSYAQKEILKKELDDPLELTDYYMSRGKYEEACTVIDRTFKEKGFQDGLRCLDQADKYAQKFNIKAKELEFLKEKYKVEEKEEKK